MFTESNYTQAGIIQAIELSDVTFSTPFSLTCRRLKKSDYSISSGTGFVVPMRKATAATVSENPETDVKGTTYKVVVEFDVLHPTEGDYSTLQQLRRAHNLLLTHAGGQQSMIRSTDEGWQYEETGDDFLHVKLTIHNVNGQQRII